MLTIALPKGALLNESIQIFQKIGLDFPICVMKNKPALHLDTPDLPKITNTRCYGFILYMPESNKPAERVQDFIECYSPLGRVYY
jgi:hypothetical protein